MGTMVNYSLITLIVLILAFFFKASIIRTYRTTLNFIKRLVPSFNFVHV